jgi:4-amino-4-deoxy-L-arabinose transferase-like glycosyltransferase
MQILIRPDDLPPDPTDPAERSRARLRARTRGQRLPSPEAVLTLLVLAALALRLWIVWSTGDALADAPERLSAEEGHEGAARALLEGRFFEQPTRVPVYPLFLAICALAFGPAPAAALIVQAVLGAAAVPLVHRLARRFVSSGLALLPAAVVALHVPLAYHAARISPEVLFTLLALWAVLALLRAIDEQRPGDFVLAGLVLGLAALCRPAPALAVALVPLVLPRAWPLGRRLALWGAYVLGFALPVLPWSWHAAAEHRGFVPLAVTRAALWRGSPEFHHVAVERGRTLGEVQETELNPEVNGGYDPRTLQGERHFRRRAVASIRAEPGLWLRYGAQKAAYLWTGNPVADWPWVRPADAAPPPAPLPTHRVAGIAASRLLPVAALLALGALLVSAGGRRRLREAAPLLLLPASVTLVHAATYPEARYGEPIHPLLATIVAVAIAELRRAHRVRRAPMAETAPTRLVAFSRRRR